MRKLQQMKDSQQNTSAHSKKQQEAVSGEEKAFDQQKMDVFFDKLLIEANVGSVNEFIQSFETQDATNQKLFEKSIVMVDQIDQLEAEIKFMNEEILKYAQPAGQKDISESEKE